MENIFQLNIKFVIEILSKLKKIGKNNNESKALMEISNSAPNTHILKYVTFT